VNQLRDSFPMLMTVRRDVGGLAGSLKAIGIGWYPIVHELFGLLDDHQTRTGQAVEVHELARAGGRLHFSATVPLMRESELAMLRMVTESWSEETCEVCGAPGFIDVTEPAPSCRCVEHRRAPQARLEHDERAFAASLTGYRRRGMAVCLFFYAIEVEQGSEWDRIDIRLIELPQTIGPIRRAPLLEQCQVVSFRSLSHFDCQVFFRDLSDRGIAPVIVTGRELIDHLDLP